MRNPLKILPNQILYDSELDSPDFKVRICWFDLDRDEVGLIDLLKSNANPYTDKFSSICERVESRELYLSNSQARIVNVSFPDEFRERHIARARSLADKLVPFFRENFRALFYEGPRHKLIKGKLVELGMTRNTVLKYLRAYYRMGMSLDAFFPRFYECGGKGKDKNLSKKPGRLTLNKNKGSKTDGMLLSDKHKEQLRFGWELFRLDEELSILEAYEKTCEEFFFHELVETKGGDIVKQVVSGEPTPSIEQFKRWGRKSKTDEEHFYESRTPAQLEMLHKPSLNSTRNEDGPAHLYQLDGTGGVIELVDELDETIALGKAHIYAMFDDYSSANVGWSIELCHPSRDQLTLALLSSFTDKATQISETVRYDLASVGIDIDSAWPPGVVCQSMIADSGSELVGHYSDILPETGLFDWDTAPPRTPTWKAALERFFRNLKDRLRRFPGATAKFKERQTKDPKSWAVLTLNELKDYLALFFAEYNLTHTISSHPDVQYLARDGFKQGCPIDYWNWGVQNKSGLGRRYDEFYLRERLLPAKYATIANRGISLNRMKYSSASLENTFAFHRGFKFKKKSNEIKVAFDPRNASCVWLVRDDGSLGEQCSLVGQDQRFEGQDLKIVDSILDYEHWFRNQSERNTLNTRNQFRQISNKMLKQAKKSASQKSLTPKFSRDRRNELEIENRATQVMVHNVTTKKAAELIEENAYERQKVLDAHYLVEWDDE